MYSISKLMIYFKGSISESEVYDINLSRLNQLIQHANRMGQEEKSHYDKMKRG